MEPVGESYPDDDCHDDNSAAGKGIGGYLGMSPPPASPKVYHILHVDRLPHVLKDGFLFSDEIMRNSEGAGTNIGLSDIKQRRLRNRLASHPDLCAGGCVPFYFCPRSVMLYVLYKGNMPGLTYQGGQQPIIHLQFDLHRVIEWCAQQKLRWAFTLGNAGASYFEDRCDLARLDEINWGAVVATQWNDPDVKEAKRAEFLAENKVDCSLVERIGVKDKSVTARVYEALDNWTPHPAVSVLPSWYYP